MTSLMLMASLGDGTSLADMTQGYWETGTLYEQQLKDSQGSIGLIKCTVSTCAHVVQP